MGRLDDIAVSMRRLEAEYSQLSRFPVLDVFADRTIITWVKTYADEYNYAAIRVCDRWFVTGINSKRAYNYEELLTFIGDGTNVRVIDPDAGLELDELVIESNDAGLPWRNRVKEARNALSEGVLTADVPVGMIMRDDSALPDTSVTRGGSLYGELK